MEFRPHRPAGVSADAGLFRISRTVVDTKAARNTATVVSHYTTAFGARIEHRQHITAVADNVFRLDEHVVVPDEIGEVPRVGVAFATVPGFDHVSWLGLGPHETYPDRKRSAILARWSADVNELAVPYLLPQENGGRADAHEFTLTAPESRRLTVTADRPVQMNVAHRTTADLETSRHWWELPCRSGAFVHSTSPTAALAPQPAARTPSRGIASAPVRISGPGSWRSPVERFEHHPPRPSTA